MLVSTVIVNYNGKSYLEPCLRSVFDSVHEGLEIIVADNGSSDRSVDYMKSAFATNYVQGNLKIIRNEENLGPAYARNQGVKIAKGEYVAFLDNDTKVDPNWLKNAIEVLRADVSIGACQCKLIIDGTNIIDCVGEYLGQNGFLVPIALAGEESDLGQYDIVQPIFAAKSAAMIVRKSVLDRIGGFDPDYFIYMEESDLCWRIWLQGYKVVLVPNCIVYHKFGTSSIILPERINYLVKFHGTKNYILTLLKNLEVINMLKILPVHVCLWMGIAFFFILKKQVKSANFILRGILWNFMHGKDTVAKRRAVQCRRLVKDKDILPIIARRKPISYFVRKLMGRKRVGHASGWDKGE